MYNLRLQSWDFTQMSDLRTQIKSYQTSIVNFKCHFNSKKIYKLGLFQVTHVRAHTQIVNENDFIGNI